MAVSEEFDPERSQFRADVRRRRKKRAIELDARYRSEWPREHHHLIRLEIADEIGVHESQVTRYLQEGRKEAERDPQATPRDTKSRPADQ